jgi:hypothetical protein
MYIQVSQHGFEHLLLGKVNVSYFYTVLYWIVGLNMYIFCSVIGPLYLLVSLKNISIRLHVVYCQFLLVVCDLLFIAQSCLLSLL